MTEKYLTLEDIKNRNNTNRESLIFEALKRVKEIGDTTQNEQEIIKIIEEVGVEAGMHVGKVGPWNPLMTAEWMLGQMADAIYIKTPFLNTIFNIFCDKYDELMKEYEQYHEIL